MQNLDIIILNHLAASTPEWIDACLNSVKDMENIYITNDPSKNIGDNQVNAILNTNNKYFGFLDNDDILIKEKIPEMINTLEENSNICGVYSSFEQIDKDGKRLFIKSRTDWSATNQICSSDYPHHFAIFRRSALNYGDLQIVSQFPEYYAFVLAGLITKYGPWKYVPVVAYKRREKEYYINHRRPIPALTRANALNIVIPILSRYV